jgi:hypothetical protein
MKPKTVVLIKALVDLLKSEKTLQRIEKKSRVYNLRRIIDKEITPTPASWMKLHDAYPNDIPKPVFESKYGDEYNVVNQTVNNNVGSNINQSYGGGGTMQEKYFWDCYKKYGDSDDLEKFIAMLISKKSC